MSVTTSLCTVLCCCNLTRKGTKVSTKILYCTARQVCETLCVWVCGDCMNSKGGGDGAACVLARWGPLRCGPARMQQALVVRRSAGCGLVLLLSFGLSPAVSAAAALSQSFLPDAVFSPTAAECRVRCNADTALRS